MGNVFIGNYDPSILFTTLAGSNLCPISLVLSKQHLHCKFTEAQCVGVRGSYPATHPPQQ